MDPVDVVFRKPLLRDAEVDRDEPTVVETGDQVLARRADDANDAAGVEEDGIVVAARALAVEQAVFTRVADDRIGAVAAVEDVGARAADDGVVPRVAGDL